MLDVSLPKRRIDMILLNKDGSVRVNDFGSFWSEDDCDWRYNLCLSIEENEKELLMKVYGEIPINYTISSKLSKYIENRKSLSASITPYYPIIKSISEADIPWNVKRLLFNAIDSELHRAHPYK